MQYRKSMNNKAKNTTVLSSGRYTGEMLLEKRPEIYKAIVKMLASRVPIKQIKAFLGVHHLTIAAVAEREAPSIDTMRKRLTAQAAVALEVVGDEIIENVLEGKMKPSELCRMPMAPSSIDISSSLVVPLSESKRSRQKTSMPSWKSS